MSTLTGQQGDGTGHIHDTATEATNKHGNSETADQAPGCDAEIDALHVLGVIHADHAENSAQIVRDESISGPLGEAVGSRVHQY